MNYILPKMITTIRVSELTKYCERSESCLYFDCKFNNFSKMGYIKEFEGAGEYSLGLPKNIGENALWFNKKPYTDKWWSFIIPHTGGRLEYKEKTNE